MTKETCMLEMEITMKNRSGNVPFKYDFETRGYQWRKWAGAMEGRGSGRHKLLGVRQAQGRTVQRGGYSQYFAITGK